MASLILIIGIVLLVLSLMTRHSFILGTMSLACICYYFYLQPAGNWQKMGLFAVGMLLLLAEIFLPAFGIVGIIGIIISGWGLSISTGSLATGIVDLSMGLLIAVIVFYLLLRLGYRLPVSQHMILQRSITASGSEFAKQDLEKYLHQEAVTTTPLRPTGKAVFKNDDIMEVVSEYEVIQTDEEIIVTKIKNNQLLVRRK